MIAWYIVPYNIVQDLPDLEYRLRVCAMNDYTGTIRADGGDWSETEVLGNRAIVKVRALVATLVMLNGVFKRIPKNRLDDPLSDLSTAAKQALKNEALDMGYSIAELQERFPNDLGTYTLRHFLKFLTKRRLKPRYDAGVDTVKIDGIEQACKDIDIVDIEVIE